MALCGTRSLLGELTGNSDSAVRRNMAGYCHELTKQYRTGETVVRALCVIDIH